MSDAVYLGIDCGTQSLRSGLFDSKGKPLAFAVEEFPIAHPKPGWAEQTPSDWWQALCHTVKKVLALSGKKASDVRGIGVDTTACTVVFCDEAGGPLRSALLWMDIRSVKEAEEASRVGGERLKYVGGSISPEWMIPKSLWIKRNDPKVYEKAKVICDCQDWLNFKLTGQWTASFNHVTCKWNYASPEKDPWPSEILQALDLSELKQRWPSQPLPIMAEAGRLTQAAAEELGLRPGIPVAEGAIDAYAGMIGMDVVQAGRMALVMGSSTCHLALSEKAIYETGTWGPYPEALLPKLWALEGGQVSTGSVVKWFRDHFAGSFERMAEKSGKEVYEILDQEASKIPPGCDGLVLLDYWQGNRTPLRDPKARGTIWGLTLAHGPAHLFRAIYEGTALGTRHILESMKSGGFVASGITACGGGTKSELWLQIHADACQVPIYLTEVAEAACLGSAILGAVAAKDFSSVQEATRQMVTVTRTIEPDPSKREAYDFTFGLYVETYKRLKDLMHSVADRCAG